ncbi:MAG: glycosyltransferase family 4 protein [Anaerolineae bacterium]|nr:glycosyltransferase family 4 protein [Anaerolineae bacterium]
MEQTKTGAPLVAFNAQLLARGASYRSAGISTYIANLLKQLAGVDAPLRYKVFLGEGELPAGVDLPVQRSRFSTARPQSRILWEQLVLPWHLKRQHVDLLHAPAFVGPLATRCPQIITVHDLSFLRYPQFFKRGNRIYLSLMTGLACRKAAAVIAVSRFTAQEVTELLGVPAERIHVIYHGVSPRFKPLPPEDVARFRVQKGLPERFILHLGTLEPRKNILTLVRAFAQLKEPDVHLVLAGGKGWLYEQIFAEVQQLGLVGRVHFPGYVPASEQTLWYNAAIMFVYISHYEGFGLPVLESLACGTPTLTSARTSLPEAAGEGAYIIPADNELMAVVEGIQRLLHDASLRASLRQRGIDHAAHFTWEKTAQETAALYRHVLSL